jgi:hypothetical protein
MQRLNEGVQGEMRRKKQIQCGKRICSGWSFGIKGRRWHFCLPLNPKHSFLFLKYPNLFNPSSIIEQ